MRFLGVNIPDNKKIYIALTYIYGLGRNLSLSCLKNTGIDPDKKTSDLTADEIAKLKSFIEDHIKVEGELRQEIRQNIERLKSINSYRGSRHIKKLPVRGQRTKTNSRTVRGNIRRTAGSGRRKLEKT